jgi:hypothetical protein
MRTGPRSTFNSAVKLRKSSSTPDKAVPGSANKIAVCALWRFAAALGHL